jgi:hypothetical protein
VLRVWEGTLLEEGNFMKFVSKAVAFGATAALATTGLVGATGTSANAAPVTKSVTYNCDLSGLGLGTQAVTTAYTIPAMPTTLSAGQAVPATPISAKVTFPTTVSALIVGGFQGHIDGSVTGDAKLGSQTIASSLTIPDQTITNGAAPATVDASGTLAAFAPARVGAQAFSLPSVVHASFQDGALKVSCAAATGSNLSLGSVAVTPAKSLNVKAPKKVKAGHVLKLKVTTTETGKAVAKIKHKKVAKAKVKKNGKATLKIKKGLKKGKNKIVVTVGSLKQTVKVKVK